MRVALLRGINVGGHRKVAMAELRAACVSAGLDDVATYIQSGNVVFDGGPSDEAGCAALIADTVEAAFGFRVPVVIRTGDEMMAALDAHPFDPPAGEANLLHLLFCDREPTAAAVAALDPARSPADRWTVIGREIHVRYGEGSGSGSSKANVAWFEKQLDVAATGRNVVTTRRLAEMAASRTG